MAAKSASDSFLFSNEDGTPMVFVITPGDTKKRLRPIVESGGGLLTSIETPGAIRLVAPNCEAGKQLVRSDFVFDSFKNGKLCNIDDYRLESKPDVASPQSLVTVKSEKALKSGRIKYSPEEDQAILDYIKKLNGQDVKLSGNKIWQEMEEKKVTCHRWQSMRSRYLSFLRQSPHTSSYKGKLEFVGKKNPSRSQTTVKEHTDDVSICKILKPSSLSLQNNTGGKVNDKKTDKENVYYMSLLDEQQTSTPLKHDHDEKVRQTLETTYFGKTENAETPTTSCTSPIVGTPSDARCGMEQDDTESCTTSTKCSDSESTLKENTISCYKGIRRYFKAQSKNIMSDEEAGTCGNEPVVVTQNNSDDTSDCNHGNRDGADDCVPVLKCSQLFENLKKLQMICSVSATQAQILHALYLTCGCLECARHYLQTGLLPNGLEIWKREEDTAISSGNVDAIEKIIEKRGQKAVNNRKQFLTSF